MPETELLNVTGNHRQVVGKISAPTCATPRGRLEPLLHASNAVGRRNCRSARAPFDAYCGMTTDGGGWTVISYLRTASHWNLAFSSDNGTVGDVNTGFSRGGTLKTANLPFNEKLIVYNRLLESGTELGKQWMKVRRSDGVAIGFNVIEGTPAGWTYSDSFGFTSAAVTNVCTHGCATYAGHVGGVSATEPGARSSRDDRAPGANPVAIIASHERQRR